MAVGGARRITSRDVQQRGPLLAAELDDVADAVTLIASAFSSDGLEIDQSGAMDHRVERAVAQQLGVVGDEIGFRDIAGDHRDPLLDVAIEARAEMLAQRAQRRRVENLAPETVEARFAIAANQ